MSSQSQIAHHTDVARTKINSATSIVLKAVKPVAASFEEIDPSDTTLAVVARSTGTPMGKAFEFWLGYEPVAPAIFSVSVNCRATLFEDESRGGLAVVARFSMQGSFFVDGPALTAEQLTRAVYVEAPDLIYAQMTPRFIALGTCLGFDLGELPQVSWAAIQEDASSGRARKMKLLDPLPVAQ